ncbi:MAG: ATP-binding cassette domain-containing protein, partial [Actinomycetota bacterium]|nr:ATP-binding cassette domain-containing protein [Actinomycetota bacterium]
MLAQLRNVSLSFPDKKVLEGVSLTVYPGDRIALVGENGAGKTSLFRMLTSALAPDSGEVSLAGGVRIGHLEQDDFADLLSDDPERTCMEAALKPFGELLELEARIDRLAAKLAETTEGARMSALLTELGEAQQSFEARGGYEFR